MPGTPLFGEVIYSLTDLIVAAYNSVSDTYSTPVPMAVGQTLMVEPQADTDELRSYSAIEELLAIVTKADITLSAGAIDRDAFTAIAGIANYLSGLTPNQVVTSDVLAGVDNPYFGVIGVAQATNAGVFVVGVQKCKLSKKPNYNLDGKANKFNVQEIKGTAAFVTRTSRMLIRAQYHEGSSTWTAPASGAAFKAFFTSPAVVV